MPWWAFFPALSTLACDLLEAGSGLGLLATVGAAGPEPPSLLLGIAQTQSFPPWSSSLYSRT
jgi:hypothetical protein